MSLFDRFRRPRRGARPAGAALSPKALEDLKEFLRTRDGIEGYIEPPTAVYAMTLCLVASDGEYVRRAVKDDRQARNLCRAHEVPLYDARIVGYPRRMRQYEQGVRPQRVSLDDLPPLQVTDEPDPREE